MQKKTEYCGGKTTRIDLGKLVLYYSFDTLVAFKINVASEPLVIIKNYWGNTTGKHLNAIDEDKTIRLDEEAFEKAYQAMLKVHNLSY